MPAALSRCRIAHRGWRGRRCRAQGWLRAGSRAGRHRAAAKVGAPPRSKRRDSRAVKGSRAELIPWCALRPQPPPLVMLSFFAYCLFNKATLCDVYAFSRGKAEWVMAIWCSNFLMVRVGGQMLPYLIVKWIRKYRFWINITDRVVKKNSCVARKPSHNKVTDFASFIRSFSDHQERWRSWSSLFTCTFWTEQM